MKAVRIGCGAGYSGDRIEPAVELATKGDLQYLVFECLAERTIAIAQQAKAADPHAGFDPLLVERMTAVLRSCVERRIVILTNMGAANPVSAAAAVARLARTLGLSGLKIAAVTGDDVVEIVKKRDPALEETGQPVSALGDALVSANAYLGIEPLMTALAFGANVVMAGRVADPSLFVAPLAHEFGWAANDWSMLGRGTLVGHLLECAGQVTGGYFADPGCKEKEIDGLARLGFPLAEVSSDGRAIITKVVGSGGAVTTATCTEQLLYEIHDPSSYTTPDVVADFSRVEIAPAGPDRVQVSGADGRARPETLKVSVGYRDGFLGEGQISYAGSGALERAKLAARIVEERLRLTGLTVQPLRVDLIGVDALHGPALSGRAAPYEVRLRVAGRTSSLNDARRIGREVETLYTNGPAAGGGVTTSAREILAIGTTFLPRDEVGTAVNIEVA